MRRIFAAFLFSLILCLPAVAAPQNGQGGFNGPALGQADVTTVAQALKAGDDTPCILEGRVVASLPKHEHFLFEDPTGQIEVNIDDEIFAGRVLSPRVTVRLYGEVEKDLFKKPEIDVDRFEIIGN